MEKLLHERLREWGNNRPFRFNEAWEHFGVAGNDKLLCAIADEIEKYYIPRPRFEDGKPVPGNHEDERVSYYYVYDDGSWVLIPIDGYGSDMEPIDGHTDEPVKFSHKVLDADGVEIKVGDTVYNVNSGNGGVVTGFDPCELIEVEAHDGGHWKNSGNNLTHEKPVFDADGERIKVGDTVYDIEEGDKYTVSKINDNTGKVYFEEGGYMSACYLSHHEPDTLERIEDDATILPYAYCLKHGIKLPDAPDMEEATIAMVHDLLRRQREVLRCDQSS